MKILKFVIPLVALILLGGFSWLALTDVPVEQKEIQKVISNDRFFGKTAP